MTDSLFDITSLRYFGFMRIEALLYEPPPVEASRMSPFVLTIRIFVFVLCEKPKRKFLRCSADVPSWINDAILLALSLRSSIFSLYTCCEISKDCIIANSKTLATSVVRFTEKILKKILLLFFFIKILSFLGFTIILVQIYSPRPKRF